MVHEELLFGIDDVLERGKPYNRVDTQIGNESHVSIQSQNLVRCNEDRSPAETRRQEK